LTPVEEQVPFTSSGVPPVDLPESISNIQGLSQLGY
jgi:hypothetical protein